MSKLDFISKLFIDNSPKLNERPSDAVWKRLESKLDSRQAHKSLKIYRFVAAAAIFLSISSVVALLQMSSKKQEQIVAQSKTSIKDTTLIAQYTEQESSLNKNIANTNQRIDSSASKIADKKEFSFPNLPYSDHMIASTSNVEIRDTTILPLKYVDNELDDVKMNSEQNNYSNNYSISSAPTAGSNPIVKTDTKKEKKLPGLKKPPLGTPASEEGILEEKEAELFANKATSTTVASANKYRLSNKLMNFEWMLGTWEDESGDGRSGENWTVRHSFEIETNAIQVLKKDTIFKERISIVANEMGVFYVADVGYNLKQLKFTLKYQDKSKAIFEQMDATGMPNEVIIQKISKNKMTITMKFNDGQLSMEQQNYLKNRNKVNRNTAVRTLIKNAH
jgi:hypothetical protein